MYTCNWMGVARTPAAAGAPAPISNLRLTRGRNAHLLFWYSLITFLADARSCADRRTTEEHPCSFFPLCLWRSGWFC